MTNNQLCAIWISKKKVFLWNILHGQSFGVDLLKFWTKIVDRVLKHLNKFRKY